MTDHDRRHNTDSRHRRSVRWPGRPSPLALARHPARPREARKDVPVCMYKHVQAGEAHKAWVVSPTHGRTRCHVPRRDQEPPRTWGVGVGRTTEPRRKSDKRGPKILLVEPLGRQPGRSRTPCWPFVVSWPTFGCPKRLARLASLGTLCTILVGPQQSPSWLPRYSTSPVQYASVGPV